MTTRIDPIVIAVQADLTIRSAIGQAEYGTTLAENKAELRAWLVNAYEEALDLALYLRHAIVAIDEGK